MQKMIPFPGDSVAGLMESFAANRQVLVDSKRRLNAMRTRVRAERRQSQKLLGEAHGLILDVRAGMVAVRDARHAAGRPAVVAGVPRYRQPAQGPLDEHRQKLHDRYAQTNDPAIRDELMASYDGFARSLALKFRHRESIDDLMQVARIGLLHAVDRFDPALGRPFPLFARITITGELKRHIRDKTWAMRVPRSLQEDYLNVMRAVDELTTEQSGSPTMEALAACCGMSIERVVEAMELRVTQRALSIDVPAGALSEEPVIELGAEDLGFGQFENRQLLAHLLGRLPERDRRIIELRFLEQMTQSEIAAEIGVSQMCVSRVLARTLGRLRLWARAAVG